MRLPAYRYRTSHNYKTLQENITFEALMETSLVLPTITPKKSRNMSRIFFGEGYFFYHCESHLIF